MVFVMLIMEPAILITVMIRQGVGIIIGFPVKPSPVSHGDPYKSRVVLQYDIKGQATLTVDPSTMDQVKVTVVVTKGNYYRSR